MGARIRIAHRASNSCLRSRAGRPINRNVVFRIANSVAEPFASSTVRGQEDRHPALAQYPDQLMILLHGHGLEPEVGSSRTTPRSWRARTSATPRTQPLDSDPTGPYTRSSRLTALSARPIARELRRGSYSRRNTEGSSSTSDADTVPATPASSDPQRIADRSSGLRTQATVAAPRSRDQRPQRPHGRRLAPPLPRKPNTRRSRPENTSSKHHPPNRLVSARQPSADSPCRAIKGRVRLTASSPSTRWSPAADWFTGLLTGRACSVGARRRAGTSSKVRRLWWLTGTTHFVAHRPPIADHTARSVTPIPDVTAG